MATPKSRVAVLLSFLLRCRELLLNRRLLLLPRPLLLNRTPQTPRDPQKPITMTGTIEHLKPR